MINFRKTHFHVYRDADYGAAPLSLVEGQDFILNLPEEKHSLLGGMGIDTFTLEINGTGEGAAGILRSSMKEKLNSPAEALDMPKSPNCSFLIQMEISYLG